MTGVIAVHVGAGYHAKSKRIAYKNTCKNACIAAVGKLQEGKSAVEAVAEAVCMLENCPLTNAGIGSNLTITGVVECDASIMDGKNLDFGSVGALSNIKNPIKVAQSVLEEQVDLLPGGRIPPCTLVGSGARDWALNKGFKFFDNQLLSTKSSETSFAKNLSVVQNALYSSQDCALDTNQEGVDVDCDLLDTVGAVCVDCYGNVASAVSSGGLLLKYSGRIGQGAVFGSGCWAENSNVDDKPSIAICTTGVGEYLIKTMFAKECYQFIYDNLDSFTAIPDFFKHRFINNPCLKNINLKLAGTLALKYFAQEHFCELSWAHNTKTMILGYMTTDSKKVVTVFSSQPKNATVGESIVFSEKCIKFKSTS